MSKANDTSVTPAQLDWASASAKREVDSLAFRVAASDILSMRTNVRVASFPAADWTWEHNLMTQFKNHVFHITGIERDPAVYAVGARNAPTLGVCAMHPRPVGLSSFLTTPDLEPFDIINLDWLGTWSKEKKKDLRRIFERPTLLRDGGLLLLTMALNRGQPETTDELYELAENNLAFMVYDERGRDAHTSGFRVRGIPQWVINEADEVGVTLRPLLASVYYSKRADTSGSPAPMVQFMFKRID